MAGSKSAKKSSSQKAKEVKAAEAESSDDEEWILDTTTPAVLDPPVGHVPVKKSQVTVQIPDLPPIPHEKESEEKRTSRFQSEKQSIDRSIRIAELNNLSALKIGSGPYGKHNKKKAHWDYLLTEMRWMAMDFASERDWKLESARRCGIGAIHCNGKPEKPKDLEESLLMSRKRRCAAVASEICVFWEKAWGRATKVPIPTAAELVPEKKPADETDEKEAEKEPEGRPTRGGRTREPNDAKESFTAADKSTDENDEKKPEGGDVAMTDSDVKDDELMIDLDMKTPELQNKSQSRFPKSPPPPFGMSEIEHWASRKLVADIARLKKNIIREAIREKEEEEEAKKNPGGKKGGKKLTAAEKKKEKEREEKEKAKAEKEAAEKAKKETAKETPAAMDVVAAVMPPPEQVVVYLPGGVPDVVLDAELEIDSVAPGTPPRFTETDPENWAAGPLTYDCFGKSGELFWKNLVFQETSKFAEYEASLRDWEESEKRRQRALAMTRRRVQENEQISRREERRSAALRALQESRRFEQIAQQRLAAEQKAKAAGKRGRGGMDSGDDSSDDEETLAALAGGRGGKKTKKELAREASNADWKKKSHKAKRRASGQARPWTPTEDQLLCAIVHEFGSNWGLITDVFAASAPFKGTYRRAEQCRWRFQALTRSAEEGEDPAAAAALNLDKGTARQTMSRALPVEDNTARLHFDRAAQAQARHAKARRLAASERAGDDASRRAPPHASWGSHRGLRGLDPIEIADQALMEAARAAQQQQQQRRQQMGPGGGVPGAQVPGGAPPGQVRPGQIGAGGQGAGQPPGGRPGAQQVGGMMPMGGALGGGQMQMNQQQQMQMQQQQQMRMQQQQQLQMQQRQMQMNQMPMQGAPPGGVTGNSATGNTPKGTATNAPHMGATYAPVPGQGTTLEMPTIPVPQAQPSPGKGSKKSAAQSPGLAPGMYNLGGGRSNRSGAKGDDKKKK